MFGLLARMPTESSEYGKYSAQPWAVAMSPAMPPKSPIATGIAKDLIKRLRKSCTAQTAMLPSAPQQSHSKSSGAAVRECQRENRCR